MQKLGLETFSLSFGSTIKNPNFSDFHRSLIIENAQVDFKSENLRIESSHLHEILCGGQ